MGSGRLLERLRRWSSYLLLDGARCRRWRRDWGRHRCDRCPDQTLTEFSSRFSSASFDGVRDRLLVEFLSGRREDRDIANRAATN